MRQCVHYIIAGGWIFIDSYSVPTYKIIQVYIMTVHLTYSAEKFSEKQKTVLIGSMYYYHTYFFLCIIFYFLFFIFLFSDRAIVGKQIINTKSINDIWLKGTVSRDFQSFFYENIRPEPHMNRQKRFRKLFYFRKDCKVRKSRASIVNDYADTQFFL